MTEGQFVEHYRTATEALQSGREVDAAAHTRALVAGASDPRTSRRSWYVGEAAHRGHVIQGLVACRRGDADEAGRHLLAATDGPTSPQILSFGPDVHLADQLLSQGRPSLVVDYLLRARRLWWLRCAPSQHRSFWGWFRPTRRWIAAIQQGTTPDWAFQLHRSRQMLLPEAIGAPG